MLDEKRILSKLDELDSYLTELEEVMPKNYEEYANSIEKKRACMSFASRAKHDRGFLEELRVVFNRICHDRRENHGTYIFHFGRIFKFDSCMLLLGRHHKA